MIFFKKLNNYEKSILLSTLFLIVFTSLNTGNLNFGNYSFLLVLIILSGMYFLAYRAIKLISFSPVYFSSLFVLIYIQSTVYSSIPIYIFSLFVLILFLSILFLFKKTLTKSLVSLLSLLIISYIFFTEDQIEIKDSKSLFDSPEGNLKFSYYTYSDGKDKHREEYKNPDFISYNLDASNILEPKWNQSKIEWRERYWEFSKEKLPLNGRLWVPEGDGKFPIISIIHGNHSMQEHSDDGYNYIGEYLSKHGFIFNSLDQNFLNGSWTGDFRGKEMTTRAWHFLENLKYLKKLNNDSSSILYNKIDFENIIVMGHSRGGEAVNIAAKFNKLKTYPDNGNILLDYNFNIKGIITLAPTDYRYFRNYKLKNVNYLSIQGSMDSDEDSFFGIRQANRIENENNSFSDFNILVEGANHSQFNTSWGQHDFGFPGKLLVNNSNILPGWLQRKILKKYVYSFLEYTINGNTNSLVLLKKSENYTTEENISKKIISRSKIGGSSVLFDFEGDELSYNKKAKLKFSDISEIKLEQLKFRGGKNQQNSALKINVSDSSEFIIDILEDTQGYNFLSFDVSNDQDTAKLEISFIDKNSNVIGSKTLKLFNTSIDLNNLKFNYLTEERFKKRNDINFSTYYVDLENKDFKSILLKFNKGKYYLDNFSLNF
ncbi:MAG: hypothetical protein P8L24_02460 [Cytophagales bacterium]|nr:hypothetical protein [Cytophagales bacterium]